MPAFRYNRVETIVGDQWSAPGAGIVEIVDRETCRLVIKLESGEVSSLRENDLCMGIFKHSEGGNSTETTTDSADPPTPRAVATPSARAPSLALQPATSSSSSV